MALKIMGRKRGMVQLFDEKGNVVVCTVIEAEPNIVTQIKTKDNDGYDAVQVGFEKIKAANEQTLIARTTKPLRGHYKKAGVEPRRFLVETRITENEIGGYAIGQEIKVSAFAEIPFLDATATSKGKGYQGVMKLHNMRGGRATHGSGFHRHMGSTGMRSTPGRCLPNGPRASHMGDERVTVQNLKVVMIKEEDNLIVVKGQVPGPRNGLVYLQEAKKRPASREKTKK
jgi:large subunit ribosomal protein L3